MIEGVKITSLKKIDDEKGSILPMLRSDSEVFKSFGEIYFSTIYYNSIKAWHLHKKAILNYACIKGKVKFVLFDDRKGSKTFGKIQEMYLSPDNYFLATIPPNIWNGFKGMSSSESIIANCITSPHNEKEMIRKDPFDENFSYKWD